MNVLRFSVAGVLAATTLVAAGQAQAVELKIAPEKALRYTIQSSSTVTTERQILIDGEEPDFGGGRGFGGGGGPVSTKTKVVFDEGSAENGRWRTYHTAESTVEREDRDGEPVESTVESALLGKKLILMEDDRGVVAFEGDTKGEPLEAAMTRGVPAAMVLAGLAPSKKVSVDAEFDLGKTLQSALKNLVHPVRAARTQGQGGRRGGGDRQGGDRQGGDRQGGGRQGGRRGGRGGRGGGAADAALQLLANQQLDCKAVGTLVSIETKDGSDYATIAVKGTLSGKGTPTELGMAATGGRGGFGGGRGGRGGAGGRGAGGGGEDNGKASAHVEFAGTMIVDLSSNCLHELRLKGKVESSSKTVRETGRGEFEITSTTEGSFDVRVACEAAPTKKSD